MQELANIDSGQLLASGIFPGLEADVCPLWTDGANVIFESGGVRKAKGLLGLANTIARPTGLRSTVAAGERRLYAGAGTGAYLYTPSVGMQLIGSFASPGGIYQFLPWDTWAVISNGADPIEVWQNAGMSAPITAPFSRANTLFGYQLQAFAGGTDNGGTLVEYSPINNVLDWTVTLTGTAGQLRLRELEGDIVAAKPINGTIGIYNRAQGGPFYYTGGTNPYAFRRPIKGVGAISAHSIVSDGVRHFGIMPDSAFVTDLVSVSPIDEPALRGWLATYVDWDRQSETYGWLDRANNLIRWALPGLSGTTFSIGYRPDNGIWTRFDDNVVLGEESGAFDDMFLAKTSRLLRQDKASTDNDGVALTSFIQTKPLDLGAKNQYKRLMGLRFKGSWSGDVRVKLGWSNSPNTAPTWFGDFPMANEIYPDRQDQQTEFVYLTIKIETSALAADWKLAGATILGDVTGYVA